MTRLWNMLKALRGALRSLQGMLLVVITFSLLAGAGWLILVPLIIDVMPLDNNDWNWLEGVTSAATFALAVGAGLWVVREYEENEGNRNLDIYRDIYEKTMHKDQIAARRFIYTQFPTSITAARRVLAENEQAHEAYKSVLSLIDYLGFLMDQGWLTDEAVIGWLSPIVVKVWTKIGPLVEDECARRPQEPDYHLGARHLAKRCQQWRAKHHYAPQVPFDQERI